MKLILVLTALIAGMLAPLQAGLNGKMGRAGSSWRYSRTITVFRASRCKPLAGIARPALH